MFKLYYCSAIDICQEKAFKQIDKFKTIFSKYNIEVYGAGFEESPIINLDTSTIDLKCLIRAHDLRRLRECDILLLVTDLSTFCPGTFVEFEVARQLGMYIIVLCLDSKDFVRNIFIETFADKVIYSVEELEFILENIVGKKNDQVKNK